MGLAVILAAGFVVDGYAIHENVSAAKESQRQTDLAKVECARLRAEPVLPTAKKMPSGEKFAGMLAQFGLSAAEAADATGGGATGAFNLRQCARETRSRWAIGGRRVCARSTTRSMPSAMLHIVPQTPGFTAEVQEIPVALEVAIVTGRLEDSLFNAVEEAGESAEVAMRLAQIFGYDLDFYTDPRQGDTFRIVLEKKNYLTGKPPGTADSGRRIREWRAGNISAAVSRRRGTRLLHGGRQIVAEGVPEFAAEIWSAGYITLQQGAIPSDFEDVPPAPGYRLWGTRRHAGADDRERAA